MTTSTPPDTDCTACWAFLTWNAQLKVYVDEEGQAACWPPTYELPVLAHEPKVKEERK